MSYCTDSSGLIAFFIELWSSVKLNFWVRNFPAPSFTHLCWCMSGATVKRKYVTSARSSFSDSALSKYRLSGVKGPLCFLQVCIVFNSVVFFFFFKSSFFLNYLISVLCNIQSIWKCDAYSLTWKTWNDILQALLVTLEKENMKKVNFWPPFWIN